jgi:hypothetical protein
LVGSYVYGTYNSIPVKHLPQTVPQYQAVWAKYVPANVIQFSFQNLTLVKQLNSSLPFPRTILHLTNPKVAITTNDLRYLVAMEFQTPNASVDIAFLRPVPYAAFEAAFANLTSFSRPVGNVSLYQVQDTATGKAVLGWLALIPQDKAVGFAPGLAEAQAGMTQALRVPTQTNASILGLPDIRKMLYVAGGASNHIALGLNSFSGVIPSSLKTLTSVDLKGSRINVTRTVEFADEPSAYSQFGTVKQEYGRSLTIIVFDSYVRASQLDPFGDLGGDYRLVQ